MTWETRVHDTSTFSEYRFCVPSAGVGDDDKTTSISSMTLWHSKTLIATTRRYFSVKLARCVEPATCHRLHCWGTQTPYSSIRRLPAKTHRAWLPAPQNPPWSPGRAQRGHVTAFVADVHGLLLLLILPPPTLTGISSPLHSWHVPR